MANIAYAMQNKTNTSDAIINANAWQTKVFIISLTVAVVGALVTAGIAWLLFDAGNKYQEAVKNDADARIATANAEAATANEGVTNANLKIETVKADAATEIANVKASADKEIARLNNETENAKKAQAEANKQIEVAKADALRAKEGIADAEARSIEASAEVARLNITVANAETRRLEAEKALFELQEKAKDRHLTPDQRSKLLDTLSKEQKGDITIRCAVSSDPEPCNFAREFAGVFADAGWQVQMDAYGLVAPPPTDRGVTLWAHITPEQRDAGITSVKVPPRMGSIVSAFKAAGITLGAALRTNVFEGQVVLYVGIKP